MEHKVTKKHVQGYDNKSTEEIVYALVEVSVKTKHCYIAQHFYMLEGQDISNSLSVRAYGL
jgi:hypothetical protein